MIQWSMDRKQEIQNQIAELQRELAGMAINGVTVDIITDNWKGGMIVHSLKDGEIIQGLYTHPSLKLEETSGIMIICAEVGYSQKFYVTKNVSYNITPF